MAWEGNEEEYEEYYDYGADGEDGEEDADMAQGEHWAAGEGGAQRDTGRRVRQPGEQAQAASICMGLCLTSGGGASSGSSLQLSCGCWLARAHPLPPLPPRAVLQRARWWCRPPRRARLPPMSWCLRATAPAAAAAPAAARSSAAGSLRATTASGRGWATRGPRCRRPWCRRSTVAWQYRYWWVPTCGCGATSVTVLCCLGCAHHATRPKPASRCSVLLAAAAVFRGSTKRAHTSSAPTLNTCAAACSRCVGVAAGARAI